MQISIRVTEIDAPAFTDANGRIARSGLAVRDGADVPSDAVVFRDDDRLIAVLMKRNVPAAPAIRHIDRAVGCDLHMPVQPAAIVDTVDRHGWPERQSAVQAQRTI